MTRKKGSTRLINFTIAFLGLVSCARALTINLDEEWELFKDTYKKKYDTKEEEAKRRQIFEDNAKFITMHNIQEDMGLHSFTLGVNDRTDVSDEELEAWGSFYHDSSSYEVLPHNKSKDKFPKDETEDNPPEGYSMEKPPDDKSKHEPSEDEPPSALEYDVFLDYRKLGFVTPVKDQGKCQASYAFAAIGALEGQVKEKTGQLVPLSAQNIIDCSAKEGSNGCEFAYTRDAYLYVLRNKGVNSLAKYPYTGKDGACNFKKDDIAASIKGIENVPVDEDTLLIMLANEGPISVDLVGSKLLNNYKSGVFDDTACNAGNFSTSALIVGYGYGYLHRPYWLLKHSRGTSWGEKGYSRLAVGKNICRISERASYPVLVVP